MTDRKPKRPRDTNQLAKRVVDLATGEAEDEETCPDTGSSERASKAAKARADALTPQQRSEIARVAASARWKKS